MRNLSAGEQIFPKQSSEGGDAFFEGAKFSGGEVDFSKAEFSNAAGFSGAIFDFSVNLEGTKFQQVPDFRRTKLAAHFTFYDVIVSFQEIRAGWLNWFKKSKDASAADKFRRLKELALDARDHEQEQEFFAKELKAKRFHETNGVKLILSYLYEWCGKFGQSVLRPFIWLLSTWFVFGGGYWLVAACSSPSIWDGLRLSAATLVPFVATSRATLMKARTDLFGVDVPIWVDFASFAEGIIGLVFIFLIGLALRNRFRI